MTPLQSAEQADQPPQELNSQSSDCSHATPTLQNFTSEALPSATRPHSFAVRATLRCRAAVPPSHVAVHEPHASQSPNLPSTHSAEQDCVLQGPTCSLSEALHGRPPFCGGLDRRRTRECWPPPQSSEQASQSDQSAHLQSTGPQAEDSWHASASPRCVMQPSPPSDLVRRIVRLRIRTPGPHDVEHWPHAVQSLTSQSCFEHGSSPHPLVSMSSGGHGTPPPCANSWICRTLWVCPPPQVRSHCSHEVQSEMLQSTAGCSQVAVSCSGPSQNAPPPTAVRRTLRKRSR
mmetsp:Transcript_73824/g.192607  ORF Transcript_73824/g.192607 Transcript_73824/m.192607 type:complete len:289 (+) Transcript_73824:1036-1902(+)